MGLQTGVFAVYYLYRSRYSFVADHCLKDGHSVISFSSLDHALTFPGESAARRFIADELKSPESGPYYVTELTVDELLRYCPEQYELRRAAAKGGAA